MKKAEFYDEPIRNVADFGINEDLDMQLGEFLDWVLEGEAWEVADGVEGEPSLEAWRLVSRRCSPRGPATQLRDTRTITKPTRATHLGDCLRAIQLWENQVYQHKSRHGSSPLDDEGLKKLTLLEIVPIKEAEELECQLHLFKTYQDLKTRIEEIVLTRTGGHGKSSKLHNLEPNTQSDLNVVEFTDADGVLQKLFAIDPKMANGSQ